MHQQGQEPLRLERGLWHTVPSRNDHGSISRPVCSSRTLGSPSWRESISPRTYDSRAQVVAGARPCGVLRTDTASISVSARAAPGIQPLHCEEA